eukprot:scaffold1080_cov159-Amphora_coffeaeformis.AAC.2
MRGTSKIALLLLLTTSFTAASDDRDEALFDFIRQENDVKFFSFNGERQHVTQNHRRLSTDYINACHDPGLLYSGTGDSGRCICDEEYTDANRILCIVEGISCNNAICTEEHDIWIFNKGTGKLDERSTCVLCADEPELCQGFDDTCFHARFDEEHQDMVECSILLQDTNPVVSCSSCAPCFHEGKWGMQFNCFEGRWNSEDSCIVGSRVGHVPEFLVPDDSAYVGDYSRNNNNNRFRNGNQGVATKEEGSITYIITILAIAIMLGLSLGIFLSLVQCKRPTPDIVTPMEDAVENGQKQPVHEKGAQPMGKVTL